MPLFPLCVQDVEKSAFPGIYVVQLMVKLAGPQKAEFGVCRHKRRHQSGLSCVPASVVLLTPQPYRDFACQR